MRTLLKVVVDVQAGNRAIKDGTIQKTIQSVAELVKPEALYFTAENGKRTAYFFFDLQDSSLIPQIAEPVFTELNAEVFFTPVMSVEELNKGIQSYTNYSKRNK